MHFSTGGRREQNLLLTITGDSERYFSQNESSAMVAIEQMVPRYTLQRFDVENNRGKCAWSSKNRIRMKPSA